MSVKFLREHTNANKRKALKQKVTCLILVKSILITNLMFFFCKNQTKAHKQRFPQSPNKNIYLHFHQFHLKFPQINKKKLHDWFLLYLNKIYTLLAMLIHRPHINISKSSLLFIDKNNNNETKSVYMKN